MQYDTDLSAEDKAAILSAIKPTGFKLLVAVPKVREKIGSIMLPDARRSDEEVASVQGQVLASGSLAYSDKSRFPDGPWATVGDIVLIPPYAGHRFKVSIGSEWREVRMINDDTVQGIVLQPDNVSRAYER